MQSCNLTRNFAYIAFKNQQQTHPKIFGASMINWSCISCIYPHFFVVSRIADLQRINQNKITAITLVFHLVSCSHVPWILLSSRLLLVYNTKDVNGWGSNCTKWTLINHLVLWIKLCHGTLLNSEIEPLFLIDSLFWFPTKIKSIL